ncbi:autophagy protein Apg5-domain-containing protein [Xylariaceae sp. FL0804]|nr:autophagy protein Apg5-domain-containing protein [Xylariaceae sp. FL0804]
MASAASASAPAGARATRATGSESAESASASASASVHSADVPRTLWGLGVPLVIRHAALPASHAPCVIAAAQAPRFGYLALLRPRLEAFFRRPCSSFHHEGVLLRNLSLGLLVDLYRPQQLPWRLTVGDGPSWDIGDTFLNSAKEADFVRNGNAHGIMSLSKENTTALWNAVQDNDYASFSRVNSLLLNTVRAPKNVPLRIYIPQSDNGAAAAADGTQAGSFRVVQSLVKPRVNERAQTLGAAMRDMLPQLFPSSRDPVLADLLSHGVPVPFRAPLEDLMRELAYPDGWLCLVVVPLDIGLHAESGA